MSRHCSFVPKAAVAQVFGIELTEAEKQAIEAGKIPGEYVSHGYDRPCKVYFCDIDEEHQIYYGAFFMGKRLSKDEYAEALQKLGLGEAYFAVLMDIPY